jgi:hypothetical protein
LVIEVSQDLVIALAGEVILLSGFGRAEAFALPFDEHGQAAADLVIVGNEQRATGTGETEFIS